MEMVWTVVRAPVQKKRQDVMQIAKPIYLTGRTVISM
jgi:hypothetical protein